MILGTLTHVRQPSPVTCGHACVAMVTGASVEDLVGRFGDKTMNDALLAIAFAEHGVAIARDRPWSAVTVHVVPSLGKSGALHYIVSDTRGGREQVLDPSGGTQWCAERLQKFGWAYQFACLDLANFIEIGPQAL